MIQFSLKCDHDHRFDSWFKSARAFDALAKAGHIQCVVCGSGNVTKAIMAPRVSTASSTDKDDPAVNPRVSALTRPRTEFEKKLTALRNEIEANSDYVGNDFVKQARAMSAGDVPERSIYGEARLDQARSLMEEGIKVIPLPFIPKQSTQ